MKQIGKFSIEILLAVIAFYSFEFFLDIAKDTNCKGMMYFASIFPFACFLHYSLSAIRRAIVLTMYNARARKLQ